MELVHVPGQALPRCYIPKGVYQRSLLQKSVGNILLAGLVEVQESLLALIFTLDKGDTVTLQSQESVLWAEGRAPSWGSPVLGILGRTAPWPSVVPATTGYKASPRLGPATRPSDSLEAK